MVKSTHKTLQRYIIHIYKIKSGGGEIAQLVASLSATRSIQVRARYDPFVTERWNSITVALSRSHQCRRLVKKRRSMCHYVCEMIHVKDPQLSVVRVGHRVPLAGFCLSPYGLHMLDRDVNIFQLKKFKYIFLSVSGF